MADQAAEGRVNRDGEGIPAFARGKLGDIRDPRPIWSRKSCLRAVMSFANEIMLAVVYPERIYRSSPKTS